MKKKLITLFCTILLTLAALTQGISLSAVTNKNNIIIGEPFNLTITANAPKGKALSLPVIDSLSHFEILNKANPDTLINETGITIQQKITITSWDSGKWPLQQFVIGKARSKPFFVTVSFALFNAQQPYHDVKEIIEVQKPPESKWWWYIIGVVFLLSLFLLFFPKGKKKDKSEFVSEETAYKKALNKLAKLKNGSRQQDQLFYTELIDILREYLLKRKNIPSWSKTSEDLVKQMNLLHLQDPLNNELINTLQISDLVKFAQFKSSEVDKDNALAVIEKTITTIENHKHAV